MAKNVVVCCDGTANEFATDHTNVLKLFRVLDNDPSRQVAFYHPGVGTMEAVGALTSVSQVSRPRVRLWPRTRRLRRVTPF
jgi:uncharacterized protein (DUF2235 family)